MDDDNIVKLDIKKVASAPRQYEVEGAPSVGLYFTCPMQTEDFEFPIQVGHAFREVNRSFYEKNMHALEFYLPAATEEDYHSNAELVSQICKNSGVVFIIKSRIDVIEKYNADGIILDASEDEEISNLREKFGDDFIIGIDCKGCIDTAKKYIDNDDIDYACFEYLDDDIIKLVEYWKSNSDKPCAVRGYITEEMCEQLVHSGVDFIGCGEFAWERKDQVAEAVKEISDAIEGAVSGRKLQ